MPGVFLQIGVVVPSPTWEPNVLECPSQRWNGRIPFAGLVRTSLSGNPVDNSPTAACRFDRGIYSAARLIKLGIAPPKPIPASKRNSTTILIRNRPGGHRSISSVMLTEEDADISSNTVCSRNRACAFRDPRVSVPTAVDAVRVAGQCNRGKSGTPNRVAQAFCPMYHPWNAEHWLEWRKRSEPAARGLSSANRTPNAPRPCYRKTKSKSSFSRRLVSALRLQ
jgi:hypothetical protein